MEILKVKNMQGESVLLAQSRDNVSYFNKLYGEDYSYYFIDNFEGLNSLIYGAYSLCLEANIYFVGEF